MLKSIREIAGSVKLATSCIVISELCQGIWPASTAEIRLRRQLFVDEFLRDVPAHPYSLEIAQLAGKIGGQEKARGNTIPTIDLMIGATALSLGYSIMTSNVRDFQKIPNLHIIPF
jgi:tRNA(fMet)-specific endonuclease VapC